MAKLYNDFSATNLMSFGKSFARLNGQPLDKSEIWYNYADLEAYAKTDAAYAGQKVVYIQATENDNYIITHYSIGAKGELIPLGSNQEAIDNIQSILTDPTTGLVSRVETLEDEMPTEESIAEMIAAAAASIGPLTRVIVSSMKEIEDKLWDDKYNQYIFMLKNDLDDISDKYDEYIIIEQDPEDGSEIKLRFIEKVGSWNVDLDDYVKKEAGSRLITQAEIDLLTALKDAEKNIINDIDRTYFTIDANRKLSLKKLSTDQIEGLNAALANKVESTTFTEALNAKASNADLEALQTIVGTKASNADLEALQTIVGTKASTSSVTELQATVNTKASIADVEEYLNGMISSYESRLTNVESRLTWSELIDKKEEN